MVVTVAGLFETGFVLLLILAGAIGLHRSGVIPP